MEKGSRKDRERPRKAKANRFFITYCSQLIRLGRAATQPGRESWGAGSPQTGGLECGVFPTEGGVSQWKFVTAASEQKETFADLAAARGEIKPLQVVN